jgi:Holliday junction resolvase RusA-like endonuclease
VDNPKTISFTIPGAPVGKGRPRFARRGRFTAVYTPEKTASFENLVKLKAEEAMQGSSPIAGAVSVELTLCVPIPASFSKKKRAAALNDEIFPTTKPDCSNVQKGVEDAMNGIVYNDDKQIVRVLVKKFYAETPCTFITVENLEGKP